MPKAHRIRRRLYQEARGIFLTFLLVIATTIGIHLIIRYVGLTRGTVVYVIPVLVAAIRWGLVASLFAGACGVVGAAYFFFPPLYSLQIRDPQEIINLCLYVVVAVVVSQLATRLKRQLEVSRRREIDLRDLYAFSRRLAVAFDVSDIHAAIEDHLAAVIQRKVVLFAGGRETAGSERRGGTVVPPQVLGVVGNVAAGRRDAATGITITEDDGQIWLVRTVSPNSPEFGVIAINFGRETKDGADELRIRVDAVLADATATLDRLGIAHAISEARMRAQTDRLRDALIGSVSHELRTPLASILGAATVLSEAPALKADKKLHALAIDVRHEAERLNNDIQNLLDATRISSDGIKPHIEWADPSDIIASAIDRCRSRLGERRVAVSCVPDLPMIKVDPVLVQQALVQIFDNAAKYSAPTSQVTVAVRVRDAHMVISVTDEGAGLTEIERDKIWERFARGDRHAAITSGSGLGLWIANAFIAANGGTVSAASEGPDRGTTVMIELPVTPAAVTQLEGDAGD